MTRTNASLLAIAVFAGASALAFAEDVDLSKVDRSIRRQPAWKSGTPQYCLFVVSAEKRVWFVVDGDDLYMDINANGDLTDAGEKLPRLERSDEQRGETRNYNRWQIPDIAGADGQPVVKNISLEPQGATGAMRVYFETVDLSRAFVRPTFATAAKDAPIIHPTGPLQLELKVQRIKTSQYGPDGVRRSRPGFSVTGQCYVHGLGPGTKYATETPDLHCKMEFPLADGKTVAQEMILYLFADWGSNRSNSTKIPFDVVDGNVRITVSVARPAAGKAVPKPVVIEKTVAELGGAPQLSQAEWDALAERAKSMGRAQPVPVREALLTIQGGRSMALSPDGKRLAVLERIENPDPNRKQYSSVVKLLDAATYKELVRLPPFAGHGNLRYTVVFSADGSRLAACNASTAMVWDATSGRELLKREGLKRVYALALSPDGKLLGYCRGAR